MRSAVGGALVFNESVDLTDFEAAPIKARATTTRQGCPATLRSKFLEGWVTVTHAGPAAQSETSSLPGPTRI